MLKTSALLKKLLLIAIITAIGLLAWPAASASAAPAAEDGAPPATGAVPDARLEAAWARAQGTFRLQGDRLGRTGDFIARVQALLDKAKAKGEDTSAVQAALDAFVAALPAARSAHGRGAAIVADHPGFDGRGHVVDRPAAIETVRALRQVIADTHTAMNGTGEALRRAILAFRQSHLPTEVPTP